MTNFKLMDISVVSGADILLYLPFIGLALMVGEFLLPTKGFMGVTGAILFVIGTIILTTHDDPAIRISVSACVLLNVVVLGSAALLSYFTYKGYNANPDDGFDLTGKTARAIDDKRVEFEGAVWMAQTKNNQPLKLDQDVRIIGRNNLTLIVEPTGNVS